MKQLKNNPLEKMLTAGKEEQTTKAQGRPRNEDLVREKGSQKGLTKDTTRATFIVDCALLEKLKDIAYTERRNIKEVVNDMLKGYITEKEQEYKDAGKEILKHD